MKKGSGKKMIPNTESQIDHLNCARAQNEQIQAYFLFLFSMFTVTPSSILE